MPTPPEPTLLLRQLADGDAGAGDQLFLLLRDELHRLAGRYMGGQAPQHTLQPTALVHEAWLRLIDADGRRINDRAHFFRLAARAMRSVLVDHARAKGRAKRGGDALRVTLDDPAVTLGGAGAGDDLPDLLDLDVALERLAKLDEPLVQLVEARFFGGLANAEIAELMGVSTRTVERGWRTARAFLLKELSGGSDGGAG